MAPRHPQPPPLGYRANLSSEAVHAYLLDHAVKSWRKPNLTWSEDPIAVITETRENGKTRVIQAKRTPPDLRLPPFVELIVAKASTDATLVLIRNNPDGLNDSTPYFADARRWLEELGAVPEPAAVAQLSPTFPQPYSIERQPDSAILRGDVANFVKFVAGNEAHVVIQKIDGIPIKPVGLGSGTQFVTPGTHKVTLVIGAKGFRAEDTLEINFQGKHSYKFTAVPQGSRSELTLWDETDNQRRKLQSWMLEGQFEVEP